MLLQQQQQTMPRKRERDETRFIAQAWARCSHSKPKVYWNQQSVFSFPSLDKHRPLNLTRMSYCPIEKTNPSTLTYKCTQPLPRVYINAWGIILHQQQDVVRHWTPRQTLHFQQHRCPKNLLQPVEQTHMWRPLEAARNMISCMWEPDSSAQWLASQ